jgi:hypothetical protein
MLDTLLGVVGNSHFEAWVVGPVLGTILGVIFAALGNRPPPSNTRARDQSPDQVTQRLEEAHERRSHREVEVHHHHYHERQGGASHGSDDGSAFLLAAFIVLAVLIFLFSAYLPQIADTLLFSIATVSAFSIAATAISLAVGRFNTPEWWVHAVGPMVLSVLCFWVAALAEAAINPEVVRFAQGLLANAPVSLASIAANVLKFFQALNSEYVQWIAFDMLAFVFILATTGLNALQCVHYIALANARDAGAGLWERVAFTTGRFSGAKSLAFAAALLVGAWFLASGHAYSLLHKH